MTYEIRIHRSAQKSLAKIPKKFQQRIIISIRALANNTQPHGCKKLSGRNAWRIRIAQYRVIYEINNQVLVITVIAINHRKNVYQ